VPIEFRLPAGLKLVGLHRATTGTGKVAVGGAQAVTVWDDDRFSPDGRVVRSGGAGTLAQVGGTAVTSGARWGTRVGSQLWIDSCC
jgi:hypothetical protein